MRNFDLTDYKTTMKDYLHTLSLMTDQKLCEYLARKGFEQVKLELQIQLIKTEIERRSGT